VADRLSRIELPTGSGEIEEALDDMVVNISAFRDKDSDCEDLGTRSDGIWKIPFDHTVSDNINDENTASDTKDDDALASYNLTDLQASFSDCKQIINYLCFDILPRDDAAARKITFQAEKYTMVDNILYHLNLPRQKKRLTSEVVTRQLVVPRNLRSYHDNRSHTGPEKTYNTLRQKFYWPNLYTDVFEWCKTCSNCQTGKKGVLFSSTSKTLECTLHCF